MYKPHATPLAHVCRYVCNLCGNLLREEPQMAMLPPQTIATVGECCASALPDYMRSMAMPTSDKPQAGDQRAERRD